MKDLFGWIEAAKAQKAHGILLQAGSVPLANHVQNYARLDENVLAAADLTAQLEGFLSPREKSMVKENGFVSGYRKLGSLSGKFQIVKHRDDVLVSFQWRNPQVEDLNKWEIPNLLLGQLGKEGGLTLVVGPQLSGKTAFLARLAREFTREKKGVVVYASPEPEIENIPGVTRVPLAVLKNPAHVLSGIRVLMIDAEDESELELAVRYAERGVNVVVTQHGADVFEVLRRIHTNQGAGLFHRVATVFQAGAATRLLPGVDGSPQTALEFVVASGNLRGSLARGAFDEARAEVKAHADKTGVRTLNQSILNLLLKRKVDLKTGFAVSLYPDELDEMLKKVGI